MALLGLLFGAGAAAAQDVSAWIDATASHALPPASQADQQATTFGLLTTRLEAALGRATLSGAGQLGNAVAGGDGRWVHGELAAVGGRRVGPFGVRLRLSGFGLQYLDPFEYRAVGLELRPAVSAAAGAVTVIARPHLMAGTWRSDSSRGDLRIGGGDLVLQRSAGATTLSLSGGALHVDNAVVTGAFVHGAAEALYAASAWTASARVDVQRTPLETEVGGGIGVVAEVRPGILLHLHAGRNVREPRFGTAGSVALSAGIAVRPVRWTAPVPPPIVAVGERDEQGRRVTFVLRAPGAQSVAATGDFSDWEPVAMERTPTGWRLELVLSPGLHHFAFLVDGEWALPPDAPGVVDDGWGRQNASVVVEP